LLGRAVDAGFTYYKLRNVSFRVAGPVQWKQQIESATWAELASLPWITPSDSSMAYTEMLKHLFADRGLELNSVVRFDSAALGRAMLEAGVGLMLMREELADQGLEQGTLAVSPIARAEYELFLTHLASRRNDPLIRAFLEAATDVWPDLRVTPTRAAA
jgi:DNA-binding transcriptional LysR family regulator